MTKETCRLRTWIAWYVVFGSRNRIRRVQGLRRVRNTGDWQRITDFIFKRYYKHRRAVPVKPYRSMWLRLNWWAYREVFRNKAGWAMCRVFGQVASYRTVESHAGKGLKIAATPNDETVSAFHAAMNAHVTRILKEYNAFRESTIRMLGVNPRELFLEVNGVGVNRIEEVHHWDREGKSSSVLGWFEFSMDEDGSVRFSWTPGEDAGE